MVAVVHGVPETAAVWRPLAEALGRPDAVTLSPPGFGAPAAFAATAAAYAGWLAGELAALGEPVDLVGHDWGTGHALRLACARPDRIRSWCIDVAGVFAPEYSWHASAKLWQTAGAGEAAVATMATMSRPMVAARCESLGVTADFARAAAEATDAETGRCILALYRSAGPPARPWADLDLGAARARPGLGIIPGEDPVAGGRALARGTAGRTDAQVSLPVGPGHWGMLQDAARAAQTLAAFWAAIG